MKPPALAILPDAFTEDTIVDAVEALVETYLDQRQTIERFIDITASAWPRLRSVFMPSDYQLVKDRPSAPMTGFIWKMTQLWVMRPLSSRLTACALKATR